jgi:hypothetical protein
MARIRKRDSLQGQPQCLRKAMIVGLPSLGTVSFGAVGAFSPTAGGDAVLT